MKVTGANNYGVQNGLPNAIKRNDTKDAKYSDFFKADEFAKTEDVALQITNYYTANIKKNNAPYPSSNCYVADVEGAQAALDKLKAEADSIDYTGMKDGEIFVAVFNRYADYFGEDFRNISWQQYFIDKNKLSTENVNMAYRIRDQFVHEANSKVNNYQEACIFAYGYEGMSKEEMRTTIIGEFVATGGSYAAYYKMTEKLERVGLITIEEHSAMNDLLYSAQLQANKPHLMDMLYEKYGHLLGAYNENMDFDELIKLVDKSLQNTTFSGLDADKAEAAHYKAFDFLKELQQIMKNQKITI